MKKGLPKRYAGQIPASSWNLPEGRGFKPFCVREKPLYGNITVSGIMHYNSVFAKVPVFPEKPE
jgi:hypothetical protein